MTVWERTWQEALRPSFFEKIVDSVGRRFDRTTVAVNNVEDPRAVTDRLGELVASGHIDGHVEVAAALPSALRQVRLPRRCIEPIPHYSDHFIVKMCQPGPRWLVHWDTDVVLSEPGDWISPSVSYLSRHPTVAVAMPGWQDEASMVEETLRQDGPFNLGYGFTDQIFLVDRSRFAGPIYRYISPASWWYPTSHIAPIFEQRVDAWMRRKHLQRAAFRDVRYVHDEAMAKQHAHGPASRVRRMTRRRAFDALQRLPVSSPALRR